ncbi:hypothetical protein Apmu_0048_05 [Acidiphilium multivorum AIU301]|nr:hypothetical protein Apmu_0048_05 [Acidiphilium multivorum AIU301]
MADTVSISGKLVGTKLKLHSQNAPEPSKMQALACKGESRAGFTPYRAGFTQTRRSFHATAPPGRAGAHAPSPALTSDRLAPFNTRHAAHSPPC